MKRVLFYFIIILIIIGGYFLTFQKIYRQAVYPRVYCNDSLVLGGLKLNEIEPLVSILVRKIEAQGFIFRVETDLGKEVITLKPELFALNDPDLSRRLIYFDIDKTLENIFKIGRQGNFLSRIKQIIISLLKDQKVDLVVEIDKEEILNILKKNFKEIEQPPQDAQIKIIDQEMVLSKEKIGFIVDYNQAIEELEKNLKNFDNKEIKIKTSLKFPEIRTDQAEIAFLRAKELFAFSPYFLAYKDKVWTLSSYQIAEWFEFKRGAFNKIVIGFDQPKILDFLNKISEQIEIKPIKPKLEIQEGRVVDFQVEKAGLVVNKNKSSNLIANAILSQKRDIDLVVEKVQPESLPVDINSLGIKELFARGISNFSGSPKNRRINIKVGAEKLNGVLIKPNEEFSVIEAIGPVNKETGFLPELVIKGDRTIPEYGGGLCQIGTTMFRLALNAGLPITERAPHSYRVVYYEPAGTDATIYQPHPDLRFINDTNHHLLIQGRVEQDNLIFEFYGTSDGRKVTTTDPEIFDIIPPGSPRFIETEELSPGEKKKVESAHAGATAILKNTINFPNNIVREETWRSHYRPWPEVWLMGKEIEQELEQE